MKLRHALTATILMGGLGTVLGGLDSVAQADDKGGDCVLAYTRTACPGQEAESYKKCDGKQSCTKNVPAASEAACQQAAVAACSNDRLTVTASKVITASYKGKALQSKAGKADLCLDYAKRDVEFNQCSKK